MTSPSRPTDVELAQMSLGLHAFQSGMDWMTKLLIMPIVVLLLLVMLGVQSPPVLALLPLSGGLIILSIIVSRALENNIPFPKEYAESLVEEEAE